MQQEQNQQEPFQEMRQSANICVGLAQIMSKMLEVFLRVPGTFGERYLNFQAVFSWLILLVWGPMLFPTEDPRPMLWAWLAATAWLLVHRVAGLFRGNAEHSRYWGRSILPPHMEPVVAALTGMITLAFSMPLGSYLLFAGIALGISMSWQESADRARVRAMRDARIEQEWFMRQVEE
jgi:hypothetical protein